MYKNNYILFVYLRAFSYVYSMDYLRWRNLYLSYLLLDSNEYRFKR